MNRKKILWQVAFLFFAVLSCFHDARAKSVTEKEAKQFAKNWHLEKWHKKTDTVSMKKKTTAQEYGLDGNLYYVISFPQGGWVIISGDDVAYPVIAFSPTGTYSEQNRPIQFQEWMENVKKDIAFAITAKYRPLQKATAAWKHFNVSADSFAPQELSSLAQESSVSAMVSPLLSTEWGQGKYYNQYCPEDASALSGYDGHVPVGCVAVAMAQIMKYHNYPATGSGSHSYVQQPYGTLSANFGATTYNWNSMPTSLIRYNSDVATLMYHAGVSVNMDYAPDGSSAYMDDAAYALQKYFKYSPVLSYIFKSDYTIAEWLSILRTELDNGRPILYSGIDIDIDEEGIEHYTGHAFVCDGYLGSFFHFNWGWGGSADGYFYLNALTAGSYDFSAGQDAIIGIRPPLPPVGSFESASCASLAGWAKDPDTTASIDVYFYKDGTASTGTLIGSTTANIYQSDLAYTDKNHGFSMPLPASLNDGTEHQIYAYAIDDADSTKTLLTNSPKTVQCGPDLIVSSSSASKTSLVLNESFTVSATVQNSGTASAAASSLRWYRSTDATISTADTQLTSKSVAGLSAGQTSSLNATVNAPATPGTYWFGTCVDVVSAETSTTNNCSTGIQVTVIAPDLTVINPSVSQTVLEPSESFSFSATVKNSGTASAAASSLRWYRSTDATISTADTQVSSKSVTGLSAGQTSTLSATLSAPSTLGTYWLGACVDEVSGESSTTNNCSSGIQLKVAFKPDLTVTSLTSPATVEAGTRFSITAQVKNQGAANATQSTAQVFYKDMVTQAISGPVSYNTLPALAINQTISENMDIRPPCKAGDYLLEICIKPGENVESDESNNCKANSLTVTGECQYTLSPVIELLLK